jgi:hypothetical protein
MMRSLDEDFAYEQLRQKRIDNMEKKATDPCELERKILDSNVAKNEAEWWARERIIDLEQQLAEREKQIVMLRELLEIVQERGDLYSSDHAAIRAALDATQDLSGLVLCDAEPVAWIDLSKLTGNGMAYATEFKLSDRQTQLYARKQP